MTVLIGGSILLIAASAIALGFGWITADESLIWTSIGASVGAGVLLSLAYLRSRTEARRPSRLPPRRVGTSDRLDDRGREVEGPARVSTLERDRPPAVTVATQSPPSTRPSTPALAKPNSGTPDAEVIAIADRKRFHRPDCRHARAKGAERISRAAARRRDYDPCGVCKP